MVDDFDDYGIDAIYYQAASETLYLFQGKLKASEELSQDEALSFCQGARKIIKQDLRDSIRTSKNARRKLRML